MPPVLAAMAFKILLGFAPLLVLPPWQTAQLFAHRDFPIVPAEDGAGVGAGVAAGAGVGVGVGVGVVAAATVFLPSSESESEPSPPPPQAVIKNEAEIARKRTLKSRSLVFFEVVMILNM
jgi:hypothetical protein